MLKRLGLAVGAMAAAASVSTMLFWRVDVIARGGPIMILILMCSMFALAIILERLVFFFTVAGEAGPFFTALRALVQHRKWKEADALCARTKGPVARVTRAGLTAHEHTVLEVERVMEEAVHEEMPRIERHHRWLATIAQISTLLGLLGTVIGMVAAFQVIESKATSANPVSPADLAGGIWQALLTTVAGLEVAIPTILAYNYLAGRVAQLQYQMEQASVIVAHWRRSGGQEAGS